MRRTSKRYMILLEILIALALVTLCILPLLTPHVAMIKQQKKFISEMKLDHLVHLLYVDMLEQMQQNKISWTLINDQNPIPIDEAMWQRIGESPPPNLKGSYRFGEVKKKENETTQWGAHLLSLTFTFEPTSGPTNKAGKDMRKIFPYTVYALRHAITPTIDIDATKDLKDEPVKQKRNAP